MSTPSSMRTFMATFMGSTLLLLALVVSFVWFMNPYGFFGSPIRPGVNMLKPEMASHARQAKAAAILRTPMDGIIIGSSRTHRGLDPAHPGWTATQVYNASLPGGNMQEAANYFVFAVQQHPIKQAVLGAEFFMFNGSYGSARSAGSETRLHRSGGPIPYLNLRTELAKSLFSVDSLADSIAMLSAQRTRLWGPILGNGLRYIPWGRGSTEGVRKSFLATGKSHISYLWINPKTHQFSMDNPVTGVSTMTYFERALTTAHEHGIDFRILISPAHAWEIEFIRIAGVWDAFEQWKRDLVATNEAVARRLDKAPFPILDFSGYNIVTTNPVPGFDARDAVRTPYMDPTHYYSVIGDLMLDKLFDYSGPKRRRLPDFGVWITSANIEAHLQQIRERQAQYHRTHPEDMRDIEALRPPATSD